MPIKFGQIRIPLNGPKDSPNYSQWVPSADLKRHEWKVKGEDWCMEKVTICAKCGAEPQDGDADCRGNPC